MVIDNADEKDVFFSKPEQQTEPPAVLKAMAIYLPQSRNGRILITSQNKEVAERLVSDQESIFTMSPMAKEQAERLLQNKLPSSYDERVASDFLSTFDYMPLALTQSAAYILCQAPQVSLAMYLKEFRKRSRRGKAGWLDKPPVVNIEDRTAKNSILKAWQNVFKGVRQNRTSTAHLLDRQAMADCHQDTTANHSIQWTWQISFEEIQRKRISAARLLFFMSFCDHQGIPKWLLQSYHKLAQNTFVAEGEREKQAEAPEHIQKVAVAGSNGATVGEGETSGLDQDIELLCSYSMIAAVPQKAVYEMHAMTQLCTQSWLDFSQDIEAWRSIFLKVIRQEYPPESFKNWSKCRDLDPHVVHIHEHPPQQKEEGEDFILLLKDIASYYHEKENFDSEIALLKIAIDLGKSMFGAQHPNLLVQICIATLTPTLSDRKQYQEAEKINRECYETLAETLGKEHSKTLAIQTSLATTLHHTRKYEEAVQLSRETLQIRERVLGKRHAVTIENMYMLALRLQMLSQINEAEQLMREALELNSQVAGKDDMSTVQCLTGLGEILLGQKRYEEAEELLREGLDTLQKSLDPNDLRILAVQQDISSSLCHQGKLDEAEALGRQVFEQRMRTLGENSLITTNSCWQLVEIYARQGRGTEARRLATKALDNYTKILGPTDARTLRCKKGCEWIMRNS